MYTHHFQAPIGAHLHALRRARQHHVLFVQQRRIAFGRIGRSLFELATEEHAARARHLILGAAAGHLVVDLREFQQRRFDEVLGGGRRRRGSAQAHQGVRCVVRGKDEHGANQES